MRNILLFKLPHHIRYRYHLFFTPSVTMRWGAYDGLRIHVCAASLHLTSRHSKHATPAASFLYIIPTLKEFFFPFYYTWYNIYIVHILEAHMVYRQHTDIFTISSIVYFLSAIYWRESNGCCVESEWSTTPNHFEFVHLKLPIEVAEIYLYVQKKKKKIGRKEKW